MSAEPLGVEARLAAGWTCPERVSMQGSRSPRGNNCGSTSKPRYVELCYHGGTPTGTTDLRCSRHATMHEQRAAKNTRAHERYEAEKARRARQAAQLNLATNLAMFVAEATSGRVNPEASRRGTEDAVLVLDLSDAKALVEILRASRLSP